MKNLCFTLACLFITSMNLIAQVTISPNPALNGICPDTDVTFTVSGIDSDCSVEFLVEGDATISTNGNTFTVNSSDFSQNLEVLLDTDSNSNSDCSTSDQTFTIPVISVSQDWPTISGCPGSVVAGIANTIELSAELLYTIKGTDDPSEVSAYNWSIESGGTNWSLSTTNAPGVQRKNATLVTDRCSPATISVTAVDKCGNKSLPQTCVIERFVESPTVEGEPDYVICCDVVSFPLTAEQNTVGLSDYTYDWDFGSWSGTAVSNFAIVTADGMSPGQISVNANACGLTSASVAVNVDLETIEPSTIVLGSEFLCNDESETYLLNIEPESCASVTWEVIPAEAASQSSGSGSSTSITASATYNGDATIIFTINTPCGVATRSKDLFVGAPKINIVGFDGNVGGGTFNRICSNLASHSFLVSLQGDSDGCVDEWDDNGTTASNFGNCLEFDYTLPYGEGQSQCAFITVRASNECGDVNQNFIFCESPWACKDWSWGFSISPNPSYGIIDIELQLDKDGIVETKAFDRLEILDDLGNLKQSFEIRSLSSRLDLSSLPSGTYYARTYIDEGYVLTPFQILK